MKITEEYRRGYLDATNSKKPIFDMGDVCVGTKHDIEVDLRLNFMVARNREKLFRETIDILVKEYRV